MGINLSHKLESYSLTSEKNYSSNYFQEAIWCSDWSYIQKFANTEIIWNFRFQDGKFRYSYKMGPLPNVLQKCF